MDCMYQSVFNIMRMAHGDETSPSVLSTDG